MIYLNNIEDFYKMFNFLSNIFMFITMTLSICWSFPFILSSFFGMKLFRVCDPKLTKFLKRISSTSSITSDEQPEEWIIGKYYIGYIQKTKGDNGDKRELFIFCSKKYFDQKIKDIDNVTQTEKKDDSDCKELIIWERYGSYHWLQYSKRTFDVNDFIPRPDQSKVIDEILELYNRNKYCVSLIHGKKGCGKSMISLLLGKKITKKDQEAHFCDTFKPTDPGDQFSNLYNLIEPTKESPLIVVLEEFDIIISKIHFGTITQHKSMPSNIYDKTSWNQFFDRFDRRYYPWVILVLTSNVKPEVIDSLDPSYIRDGRINKVFELC